MSVESFAGASGVFTFGLQVGVGHITKDTTCAMMVSDLSFYYHWEESNRVGLVICLARYFDFVRSSANGKHKIF